MNNLYKKQITFYTKKSTYSISMFIILQNLNIIGFLYSCSFYFLIENKNYMNIGLNMLGFFLEKSNVFIVFLNMLWGNVGLKLLFSSGEEIKNLVGKFIRLRNKEEKRVRLAEWIKKDDISLSTAEELKLLENNSNYDDLYTNYLKVKSSKEEKVEV